MTDLDNQQCLGKQITAQLEQLLTHKTSREDVADWAKNHLMIFESNTDDKQRTNQYKSVLMCLMSVNQKINDDSYLYHTDDLQSLLIDMYESE